MRFSIYDIESKEWLATIEGKGEANKKFAELKKKYPDRKLQLKKESK